MALVVAASLLALASHSVFEIFVVDSFRTSLKRSQLEAALSLSSVTAPIVSFLVECSLKTCPEINKKLL